MTMPTFDNTKNERLFAIFNKEFLVVLVRMSGYVLPTQVLNDYAEWGGWNRKDLTYDVVDVITHESCFQKIN